MLLKSFAYTSYDDGYKYSQVLPKILKKHIYDDLNNYIDIDSIIVRQLEDVVAIYYVKDAKWFDTCHRKVKIVFGVIVDFNQLKEINYLKLIDYCYNYSINSYEEIPTCVEVPIECFNKIEDVLNEPILNVVLHKKDGFSYEKLTEEKPNIYEKLFEDIKNELFNLLEEAKRKNEILDNIYNKLSKKDENNTSEIEIEGIFKKKKETKKFIVHKIQST